MNEYVTNIPTPQIPKGAKLKVKGKRVFMLLPCGQICWQEEFPSRPDAKLRFIERLRHRTQVEEVARGVIKSGRAAWLK